MAEISKQEMLDMLEKYDDKIKSELGMPVRHMEKKAPTKEYIDFKKENLPNHLSLYEKACNISEKFLKIKADKKSLPAIKEAIAMCHLNATPSGVTSFAISAPLLIIIIGSFLSYAMLQSIFFVGFFLIAGIVVMMALQKLPYFLANSWRMKASNQMVLCIFYVVTYMRHTSNLENAIDFAAEHLMPPLSLDLKRVIWNVETQNFDSVKEALDDYLESWRKYNMEFVEAFHLVESSLYENSEQRRLELLDRSLDVILDETYEKMLHYAHNLKSPITMLHMMGIILPILGLVILPLVVSFMEGVAWYHIALLYNVILPIAVWYMGKNILSNRPTGYGDTDLSKNPDLKKKKGLIIAIGKSEIILPPIMIALTVGIVLMFLSLSPLIMHAINAPDFGLGSPSGTSCGKMFCFLEYKPAMKEPEKLIGPFGMGASIISLLFPISLGLGIGLYFRFGSKNIMEIRNKSKKLEDEFASALFQLGSRLGDGLPAEIAFGKVSKTMHGTVSGSFFELVSINIRKLGMGVEQAIFNSKTGALVSFPSSVIESSMKVLIQSVKKGPKIAAQALMNVARYIKEIHKVNERLKDLMADVISSMKFQISFLTPVIAGIVIGITSMMTSIIGRLSAQIDQMGAEAGSSAAGLSGFFGDGIPTFYFQIVVGLYVVQIVYILTQLTNGIENGADKLNEKYLLGKNLINSTLLYCFISLVVMILFNLIASRIVGVTMAN